MIFAKTVSCWILTTALGVVAIRALAQNSPANAIDHYSDDGQKALASGDYDQARKDFEELRQLEPQVAEVHASLGLIYFQQRHFDESVSELQQALKLKPAMPQVRPLLAMSLSELGEYKEALPELEKCFHQPGDPEVKRLAGLQLERAYNGLGANAKAVTVALEMGKLYPDDPEVLYHSAQIYGNSAYLTLEHLSKVAPNSPWRTQAAAEASESQGATAAAIDEYRKVLAISPSRPGIHYRIGRALLERARSNDSDADRKEALKEFQAELAIDPANANASYELAVIEQTSGHIDEARKYFETAIRFYPEFEDAHLGLAAVYLSDQKPKLAVPELRKVIAMDPGNEVSWYRLAQAERALGDVAGQNKALAEFKRLHQDKLQHASPGVTSSTEITKQKIDTAATP